MSKRRCTAAALLLALTASTAGAAPATTHFYGQSACRDVALTFDAEFSSTTSALVQKLEDLNVTATFFLLGQSIDAGFGNLVKRIGSRHQIGNHSYSHPSFSQLTPGQMQAELAKTEALVVKLTGRSTKPFFRPPYGDGYNDPSVLNAVGEAGYSQLIHWSVETADWQTEQTAAGVTASILNGAQTVTAGRGQDPIVLMHGTPEKTIEGVGAAVPILRERGYQFVTVAELLDPAVRAQRDFGGQRYRIQSGDTPATIAACHNSSAARLMAYNGLREPVPGVEIMLPYRDEVLLRLNGQRLTFPVRTRLVGERTMVHLRIVERLGAQVSVDAQGIVTVTHAATGKQFRFQAGSDQVLVNGQAQTLVQPTLAENGRMLVPLAFVVAQFGLKLNWNTELLEASLTT